MSLFCTGPIRYWTTGPHPGGDWCVHASPVEEALMSNSHRMRFRRSHDPWWDLEGRVRQRRIKAALDIGILGVAIATLAVVFGSGPVIGF